MFRTLSSAEPHTTSVSLSVLCLHAVKGSIVIVMFTVNNVKQIKPFLLLVTSSSEDDSKKEKTTNIAHSGKLFEHDPTLPTPTTFGGNRSPLKVASPTIQ